VMPGYNNCPYLDGNRGANSSRRMNRYLYNDMHFGGIVLTDGLAANTAQSIDSMSAGIDVMSGAPSTKTDLQQLATAIGIDRINESCRRILETKVRLGMFENPYGDPTCKWTNTDHHAIALEACKKSITLLKNDGVLPLKLQKDDEVVVGGPRCTWNISDNDPNVIWQSIYYNDPQVRTYVKAMSERGAALGVKTTQDTSTNPKVAVIIIGEKSYTHGTEWQNKDPNIPADQIAVVQKWHDVGVKTVVVVISPRPYVLTPLLPISDALLLVYRGGTAIGQATAGLLYGDYQPSGKLPFQVPRSQDQIGTDTPKDEKERWDLPYDLGATDAERAQIRAFIAQDKPVPPTFGDPLFQYGAGMQSFDGK
jgi:beta-glucosidase